MDREIIEGQVLLDILLNQTINSNSKNELPKILDLYLRKLSCFGVAIYNQQKWTYIAPKALKLNTQWSNFLNEFSNEIDNVKEPFYKSVNNSYVYFFPLYEFGYLVLLRKNIFSKTMFFELKKVVDRLGRDLCREREIQKLNILNELINNHSDSVQIAEESGRMYYINKAASLFLGIPQKEVNRYSVGDLDEQFKNNLKGWKEHVEDLKSSGQLIIEAENINQVNGKKIPVELTVSTTSFNKKNFVIGISRDISKRKKQENKLAQTKQQLESIFDEMTDAVYSIKLPENKVLFVTPSLKSIFEINNSLITNNQDLLNLIMVKHNYDVSKEIQFDLEKNGHFTKTYKIETNTGSTKWIRNKGQIIYDNNSKPVRLDGVISDRTEEYFAKKSLDIEVKLQNVLIDIASTYINLDPKNLESVINSSLEKIGLFVDADRAYIFDYDFSSNTTSNTFEWCKEGITPEINNLQQVPTEYIPQWLDKHKKGEPFYISDVSLLNSQILEEKALKDILEPQGIKSLLTIPVINENDLIGFVGFDSVEKHHVYSDKEKKILSLFGMMLTNIRNRQKLDNQLRVEKEKFQNIIANMNLGLLEIDLNDKIIFANQSFCDMSGYNLNNIKGENLSKFFLPENILDIIYLDQDSTNNKSDSFEINLIDKRGEEKWWFVSSAKNYNEKGNLIGRISIHLDITIQKQLEKELARAIKKAESASKAKELFLANMSHEIRTPLNVIIGMIRQLNREELTLKQHFYVTQSENSAKHLLTILNNILDITKIESGEMEIENISFSPSALAFNIHSIFSGQAHEKNLNFTVDVSKEIAPVLIGDDKKLRQVLFNLVGNSIKFTNKGSVNLKVDLIEDYRNSQTLKFIVIDTGIGMTKDFISKVFDKFTQEESNSNRSFEGSGLGLTISNDLVKLMGSEINVVSSKEKGSSFSFTLNLKKGDLKNLEPNLFQVQKNYFKGKKVLLVEDNEMNRFITIQTLEFLGIETIEAENGAEAIKLFEKQDFDLILMDIQMPILDGVEATNHIRKTLLSKTPIIALTANAFKHEIELYLEIGMNDYLIKPFDEEELCRKIEQAFSSPKVALSNDNKLLYNLNSLKKKGRNNNDFIKKMINLFINEIYDKPSLLEDALKNNDFNTIKKIIHKVKPSILELEITSLENDLEYILSCDMHSTITKKINSSTQKIIQTLIEVCEALKNEY